MKRRKEDRPLNMPARMKFRPIFPGPGHFSIEGLDLTNVVSEVVVTHTAEDSIAHVVVTFPACDVEFL